MSGTLSPNPLKRENTVVWFNRICWVLTAECALCTAVMVSRGNWWLGACFAGLGLGLAFTALTEPRNVIHTRREG